MATLKDIAEQAGVSIGTVDRIIHKRGRFSPVTADKVHRIMEELDYRPNVMARQLSRSGNCDIAAILPFPDQDSGYWDLPLSGMQRAQRDLEPFGVALDVIHYDRYDHKSFVDAGLKLLKGNFDGILMAPLQADNALSLMRELPESHPVMFFDTDLPESNRDGYIGQDSYMSGKLGARLINMMAGQDSARFLVIAPETRNEHLDNRIMGFQEGVSGETEVLRVSVESNHNFTQFQKILESGIAGHVRGIFVVDASTHFAAEYLSRRPVGRDYKIPLVGYDLVPGNRKWLKEGTIDYLLTQRPAEQGYRGINRLFRKIFLEEECPEFEYTPIDIVCEENLAYLTEEESL